VRRGTLRNFVGRRGARPPAAAPPAAAPPAARAPRRRPTSLGRITLPQAFPRGGPASAPPTANPRYGSPRGARAARARALHPSARLASSSARLSIGTPLRPSLRNVFPQARTPRSDSPPASRRAAHPSRRARGDRDRDAARARGGGASRRGSRAARVPTAVVPSRAASGLGRGRRGCRSSAEATRTGATLAPPTISRLRRRRRRRRRLRRCRRSRSRPSAPSATAAARRRVRGASFTTDRRRVWTPLAASLG